MPKINVLIKRARKSAGFRQVEFAKHIHMDVYAYGQIERGVKPPTMKQRHKIGKALGIDIGGWELDSEKIGGRILDLLDENSMSQKQLGEEIGINSQYIYRWTKGTCIPDDSMIEKIAEVFNISIDDLIDGCSIAEGNDSK